MKDRKRCISALLAVAAAALVSTVSPAGAGIDPAGTISTEPSNPLLRNDIAHNGTQNAPSLAPIVVRVDGGFDWVSAGVGAAGGCGSCSSPEPQDPRYDAVSVSSLGSEESRAPGSIAGRRSNAAPLGQRPR